MDLWYFGGWSHVVQCTSCTAGVGLRLGIRYTLAFRRSRLDATLLFHFKYGREQLGALTTKMQFLSRINYVLVQEVLTHQEQLCSTVNKPPRADDVKLAGDEITHVVNNCCSCPMRAVVRCRKPFNAITRRAK